MSGTAGPRRDRRAGCPPEDRPSRPPSPPRRDDAALPCVSAQGRGGKSGSRTSRGEFAPGAGRLAEIVGQLVLGRVERLAQLVERLSATLIARVQHLAQVVPNLPERL